VRNNILTLSVTFPFSHSPEGCKKWETASSSLFSLGGRFHNTRFLDPFKHVAIGSFRKSLVSLNEKVDTPSMTAAGIDPEAFRKAVVAERTTAADAQLKAGHVGAAMVCFLAGCWLVIQMYLCARGESVKELLLSMIRIEARVQTPFGCAPVIRVDKAKKGQAGSQLWGKGEDVARKPH